MKFIAPNARTNWVPYNAIYPNLRKTLKVGLGLERGGDRPTPMIPLLMGLAIYSPKIAIYL